MYYLLRSRGDGYFKGSLSKGAFKTNGARKEGPYKIGRFTPGDPLTPNIGATGNAKRLDRSEAANLLKIPVLPISYGDAQPLLGHWRSGRSGKMAGGIADHLSHRTGTGKGPFEASFDWKLVAAMTS